MSFFDCWKRYGLLFLCVSWASYGTIPTAIVGGEQNFGSIPYAALIYPPAQQAPLSPLLPNGFIQSVDINSSGYGIIGGAGSSPSIFYAALVSPSGLLTPLSPFPPTGNINSVAINSSGKGIIGGTASYAAFVSPSGNLTVLSPIPASTPIGTVAINSSGEGIIGGINSSGAYAALVSSSGVVKSLSPLPTTALINSVDINDSGNAIIGGETLLPTGPVAALVSPSGNLSFLSPLPTDLAVKSVAINSSGNAILAGGEGAAAPFVPYAALVSPSGGLISLSSLPATGRIFSADINSSGYAIIGGEGPYAAFVSPTGTVTSISSLPGGEDVGSIAINSFGAAIIGYFNGASNPSHITLVSPFGEVTNLLDSAVGTGIFGVAIVDQIPTNFLTGNNLIFANYINEFAPQDAFYFGPSFYDGTMADALESAAPTRNAASLYTASNNLFFLTTSFATHLRNQRFIQPRTIPVSNESNEQACNIESEDQLLAASSKQTASVSSKRNRCNELPYMAWFQAIGAFAYQKAQNETPGFNPSTGGGILSFDAKVSEHTRVGGSVSYLFTHIHENHGMGHCNINQEDLFAYASWENEDFYVDGVIGGGLFQTDQTRNIRMVGFHFKSSSHPDGWQLVPHFEFGYVREKLTCENNLSLNPFIMLDWANAWQSGYREKGHSPFNAGQKHHYSSLLRTEAGLRFYETLCNSSWRLIFEEKASYVNTHSFKTGTVHAFLVGSPGSFTVETLNSSQNLGVGQFAITFDPLSSSYYPITTAFYQGEFGTKYQSHQVSVELAWNF